MNSEIYITLISKLEQKELAEKTLSESYDLRSNDKDLCQAVQELQDDESPKIVITIDYIQTKVCEYFSISREQLHNPTRKRETVQARQIAIYFSKELTKNSFEAIGNAIGGKDHATSIHSCKVINNLIETDQAFKEQIREIECKIKGYPYTKIILSPKKPIQKRIPKIRENPQKKEEILVKKTPVKDTYSNNLRNFDTSTFSKIW